MNIDSSLRNISSGLRINSGADDPAGLSIAKNLESQDKSQVVAANNSDQGRDALKTAEASLQGISDNLTRLKELAVQASNGVLSGEQKQNIQSEVDNIKSEIQSQAQNTSFNGTKLLDGSFNNVEVGNAVNGQGSTMTIKNTSLESLGIENFDVTGSFDIADIDSAISKVSEARADIGATSNRLQSSSNSLRTTQENILSSRSRIEDADIASEIANLKKNQILQQFNNQLQTQRQEQEKNKMGLNLIL